MEGDGSDADGLSSTDTLRDRNASGNLVELLGDDAYHDVYAVYAHRQSMRDDIHMIDGWILQLVIKKLPKLRQSEITNAFWK